MEKYLFKISLYSESIWGVKVKPVYYVASNKEDATKWAESNLKQGIKLKSVSMLARQLAPHVYTGEIVPKK